MLHRCRATYYEGCLLPLEVPQKQLLAHIVYQQWQVVHNSFTAILTQTNRNLPDSSIRGGGQKATIISRPAEIIDYFQMATEGSQNPARWNLVHWKSQWLVRLGCVWFRSIQHWEFYTNKVLRTHNRKSISIGTSSSQHCPSMREEHCETAHLATTEWQHGLVRNPTDLQQKDSGNAGKIFVEAILKLILCISPGSVFLLSHSKTVILKHKKDWNIVYNLGC